MGFVTHEELDRLRKNLNEKIRTLSREINLLKQPPAPTPANLQPLGIGPYLAPGEMDGLRTWVLHSAKHGCGIVRVIPLASSWLPGLRHPFVQQSNGKYDLSRLDPVWSETFRAGLQEAEKQGVTVLIDLFDEVGLEMQERQDRHPFNGRMNCHPDAPIPGEQWTTWPGIDETDARRTRDFKNQIEHALKGDWPGDNVFTFRARLREYVDLIVDLCRGYEETVILCVGNETESRSVEVEVITWLTLAEWSGPTCINGTYLYDESQSVDSLLDDSQKRQLLNGVDFIRLHHFRPDTVAALMQRARQIVGTGGGPGIIADSDGAGSGSVRGERNRPTYEQEAFTAQAALNLGANFWVSKILGDDDSLRMLAALQKAVQK